MIKENNPISMTEAIEYLDTKREKEAEVKAFIKKFTSLSEGKQKDLREKLEGKNLLKLRQEHIAKIVDFLPEDKENLNKFFTDISLTDEESNEILKTIEEFR